MNLSTIGLCLTPDAPIDLQLHTTFSDGRWTLESLFDYLLKEQFGLVAITDHDCVETAVPIQTLALKKQLPVLVAVEMSTSWQGKLTDLLCFGFDPNHNSLHALAQDLAHRQRENSQEVYENLERQGCRFPHDALPTILAKPSAQQPHALFNLLQAHGYGQGDPSAGQRMMAAGFKYITNDPAALAEATHQIPRKIMPGATGTPGYPGKVILPPHVLAIGLTQLAKGLDQSR